MLFLNGPDFLTAFEELQEQIADEDVFNGDRDDEGKYGLETEPHITVLYGLHTDDPQQLTNFAQEHDFSDPDVKIVGVGVFENEDYDVLKLEVQSPDLHRMNGQLRMAFEYTSDFPGYKPHATLSYLKKGEGAKYVAELNKNFSQISDVGLGGTFIFNVPDGTQHKLDLRSSFRQACCIP